MQQNASKVDAILQQIRSLIDSGTFADGRLPSEPALAHQLNASRATIRSALTQLETDGLIMRKHGSGTFINHNIQGIQTRLEEVWDFAEMIEEAGYAASVRHCWLRIDEASPKMVDQLELEAGDETLSTANVFLADNEPVIYVIDVIPARLVREAYREEELHGPVYKFLERRCHQQIDYNITEVMVVGASQNIADHLNVAPAAPLHYFEEIAYNAAQIPIMASQEYYRPNFFNFKVLRKMTTRQAIRDE